MELTVDNLKAALVEFKKLVDGPAILIEPATCCVSYEAFFLYRKSRRRRHRTTLELRRITQVFGGPK